MQYKADLRLFDSRLDMKTRGTVAPWSACSYTQIACTESSPGPHPALPNIQRICKVQACRANFRQNLAERMVLGRAMAGIGEATSCNRSKCGRIILISREWFPTCLIYYCPRDQHRCHPRLGLLDSKFIALWYWLPHFFFSHLSEPRKKKKKISPVLFSLFDTFVSINFYYRKKKKIWKHNRHKLARVSAIQKVAV